MATQNLNHAKMTFSERPLELVGSHIGVSFQPKVSERFWESATVSHKRVFALSRAEQTQLKLTEVLQKPVFALRAVNRSVRILFCVMLWGWPSFF